MFSKLEREKVFRDPLYGYIRVNYKIIADLIDTKEVQRLRRIRQLSGVSQVFHTAEHSRFTHSLGAYEMARLAVHNVTGLKDTLSEYEIIVFLASALLHDLGHGPYSHAFESVLKVSHEDMTINLILGKTEVNKVLSISNTLANDIASVIRHDGKFKIIETLISSQLDVDRMDYLSRDAYFTGAVYGTIDYERIMRTMMVYNNQIVFLPSSINSIESYLMSRYHMYFQVYFHPVARAYELLFSSMYKRIYDLNKEGKDIGVNAIDLIKVMDDPLKLDSYIMLDDDYVNGLVKNLIDSNDDILRDLSRSILNRDLFNYIEINEENKKESDEIIESYKDGIKSKYYFYEVDVSLVAYMHENQTKVYDINDIKILDNNKLISIFDYSKIIKGLVENGNKEIKRIYYKEPK
jgi:HD superfamily phosphohydrolase